METGRLVLTRTNGQTIWIGNVRVTVYGAKVKLAIEAPKEVPIVRGELRKDAA